MTNFIKRLLGNRRGNALAIAAAALPLVIGSAGLATDTIQWTLWKRQLQRTADSGAIAGVRAKMAGLAVGTCTDVAGATYSSPVGYDVKTNSHLNMIPTCVVTNPPSSGTYASDANAVRVALAVTRKLSFSGLFMPTPPTIRATALATIVPSGQYCVISLEEQSYTGINASGSTTVNMGCGMATNSTSMTAAIATGSATITATPIAAVGGIPSSTQWGSGTVLQPFNPAQEDPFKDVSAPTPSSCSNFNYSENKPGGLPVVITPPAGGVMCFKSNMDIKGDITLNPGVYVMDSADVRMTNTSAKLTCIKCTIIMTTSGTDPTKIGGVDLAGGTLDLTPPDSGTYKGIVFYQDRRATADNSVKINGNSVSKIEGALYFPRADLTFNGTSGMNTNCMQIVSKRVEFTGNSGISNTCPSGSGASSFAGKKIRLVE